MLTHLPAGSTRWEEDGGAAPGGEGGVGPTGHPCNLEESLGTILGRVC